MDLNTEMRKILKERNVSLQILSSKGCRQWYNTRFLHSWTLPII